MRDISQNHLFEMAKVAFIEFCEVFEVPVPKISPALSEDKCDYTSRDEVRLNLSAAVGTNFIYYIKHNFSHYLCELHASEDEETSHRVVDILVKGIGAHLQKENKILKRLQKNFLIMGAK